MANVRHLRLEDIIEAFREFGGEANWHDIEAQLTAKRGGSHAPYKDQRNYKNTMFQFIQKHCANYSKFTGRILFERIHEGRFRLVTTLVENESRKRLPPEDIHPEIVLENKEYIAGAVRQVLVNAYERDPTARRICLEQHGTDCAVCKMNFERQYGSVGKGFIHVHHKKPLATREIYKLDPVNDLVPVCPNCHSMLHTYNPPLTVEELQNMFQLSSATEVQ